MAFSMAMPWNSGETKMHSAMRVPEHDNPTSSMLTPQAAFMLQRAPLLAIGTLDSRSRPWTSLWGGSPGFSQPLGGGIIGTRTIVDGDNDPVVRAFLGDHAKGEMVKGDAGGEEGGKKMAGLAIDLMTRKRVKIAGHMVAGTVGDVDIEYPPDMDQHEAPKTQDQIQLVYKVDQSLGNCPKYLNQYEIQPALITPSVQSDESYLTPKAKTLIQRADMFFLSSATDQDMDTNHRGGPAGFVRVISDNEFIYPEYSGNRLYQSLGNLSMNPAIGVTFPDYETRNVLYTTGMAEILVGDDAALMLPGSNLAVKIRVSEARFVSQGLPFRGTPKVPSPYNPLVRTLASEGNVKSSFSSRKQTATLVNKTSLTPSISRFSFSAPDGVHYTPGQWVALDFSAELEQGYSHMRDDDPLSLNDDWVRTFTISSYPSSSSSTQDGRQRTFEITVRRVGPVTKHLFFQNPRAEFSIPILGIGGDFKIRQLENTLTPFVAGGVGITPLLGHLPDLALTPNKLKLYWTVRVADIGLVVDTLRQFPDLGKCMGVYLTGTLGQDHDSEEQVKIIEETGATVFMRRLVKQDLLGVSGAETWYLCAGKTLRKEILGWLEGKKVVFEDFDY